MQIDVVDTLRQERYATEQPCRNEVRGTPIRGHEQCRLQLWVALEQRPQQADRAGVGDTIRSRMHVIDADADRSNPAGW
jgi:hypothetical protein